MVKEFQLLRKQLTQTLQAQQEQEKELTAQGVKQEMEKRKIFLDIISIIELLDQKEKTAIKALQLETVSSHNISEIYNNIKNDLVRLLAKHDVRPVTDNTLSTAAKFSQKPVINTVEIAPKIKFSYDGKMLN